MSRHEGVSCDSCLKGNFRGRRYKCLVCYDYDLCGACYDAGSTTTRHTTEHPMQCILTRNDLELYYEGEGLEQQQAFTCPFCGKMGYTESALHEHVTADHTVSTFEVVCPICAAQPGGDPNLITDDFASHLSLEHRSGPRDLISFLDEPSGSRHSVRRIPHPTRGVGSSRNRNRTNMHFSSSGNASSLSSRDAVDPIAELLSQLSGVRRSAGSGSSTSQLAHIQMQLQLERQQVRAARQQLERLPRRQNQASSSGASHAPASASSHGHASGENPASSGQNKQHEFLLSKSLNETLSEEDKAREDQDKLDRLLYVQSVLLGSLKAGISMGENPELSPLLPQLDLLALSPAPRPPPPPPASQSDARGVTNIAVGGASYTGSPFQLKLDVLSKQAPTPPHNTKPFPSAPEVTPPSPLPLTRTIAIPPPSSSAHEKTASSGDVIKSSPREFVGPTRVSKLVGPPRDVSKIVGPNSSFNRTGSSEDSGGSRDFSKTGPPSELRNVGPSEVPKIGPSEVRKIGPSEVPKIGPSEVPKIGPSEARTCDVSRGGGPTSDVSSESPSVNDDVTNSTTSPSPSNAKLILAKKLSHNTRPSDIGTIRKLVALRAKAARQSPDPSESLPTPQAANH